VFFVPTSQPKPDPVVKPDKVVADMPRVDPVPVPPVVIEPQEEVIEVPLVDLPPQAPSTGEAISEPSPLQVDPNKALTRPEYPATSIRLNEEGKVKLLVYVLPDGRVGDVKVSRSSGYARLDASAMREARKSWRFLPAKNNSGQAVAAWGTFEVAFQLQN
jgi:protein TonB